MLLFFICRKNEVDDEWLQLKFCRIISHNNVKLSLTPNLECFKTEKSGKTKNLSTMMNEKQIVNPKIIYFNKTGNNYDAAGYKVYKWKWNCITWKNRKFSVTLLCIHMYMPFQSHCYWNYKNNKRVPDTQVFHMHLFIIM